MTNPNPNPKSLSTRLVTEPATQMHRRSDGGSICVISGHQWSSVVISGHLWTPKRSDGGSMASKEWIAWRIVTARE